MYDLVVNLDQKTSQVSVSLIKMQF